MPVTYTIARRDQRSLTATGGSVTFTVAVGPRGPNLITDATALGTLTDTTTPAFLLVGAAAGDRARKLTPTGWGLSNLLATVPAGRVPYADAGGLVTSNAGFNYNSGTSTLTIGTGNSSLVGAGRAVTFASNGIFAGHANLQAYGDVVLLKNTGGLGFSASSSLDQYSTETKIARGGVGLLGVYNNADGTLRDFTVRNLTASGQLVSTSAGSIASPSIGWDVSGGRHGWYLFDSGTPTTAFVGAVANGNLHTATRANSTTFTNGVSLGWATGSDPTVGQTVGFVPSGTNTLRVTNGSTGVGNLIAGNLTLGNASAATADLDANLSGASDPLIRLGNATISLDPARVGFTQVFTNTLVSLGSAINFGWSVASQNVTSVQIGFSRVDANTVEVNNGIRTGSGGALRGLRASRATIDQLASVTGAAAGNNFCAITVPTVSGGALTFGDGSTNYAGIAFQTNGVLLSSTGTSRIGTRNGWAMARQELLLVTSDQLHDITTRNDPGLIRNDANTVRVTDSTGGGNGNFVAANLTASGLTTLGTYTVATLPSASANAGAFAQVTDSNSTTNGNTVAGGGSNRVPVFSNGTNWVIK